ncbi:hypothetical protein HYD66_00825 [Mycoplasmopsis bovis]|nr:hypothetical protein [Mycoplasmopsis bovis]QQH55014.1 hypothetical protein HYD66_00825 [Mycoplasmopsis bovis]
MHVCLILSNSLKSTQWYNNPKTRELDEILSSNLSSLNKLELRHLDYQLLPI